MANITVTIEGFESLKSILAGMPQEFQAASEDILDESAAVMLYKNRQRFLNERNPDNQPWTPSRSAIIRRSGGYTYRDGKGYTGTGTLYETGNLFRSIQLFKTSTKERQIGTDVEYGPKLMKKWPFLGINTQDNKVIEAITKNRLSKLKFV